MIAVLLFSTAAMCNMCSWRPPFNVSIVISPTESTEIENGESGAQTTEKTKPAEESSQKTESGSTEPPSGTNDMPDETVAETSGTSAAIEPSGYPAVTLKGGTGYIFETSTVAKGSDDRDIWWNAIYFVPDLADTSICSLGNLSSPGDVKKINTGDLKKDQVQPAPGEVFAIKITKTSGEVSSDTYVVFRVLSIGNKEDATSITIEYLYPFEGEIIQ